MRAAKAPALALLFALATAAGPALAQTSDAANSHLALGQAAAKRGDLAMADRELKDAIAAAPGDTSVAVAVGTTYYGLGRTDEAIKRVVAGAQRATHARPAVQPGDRVPEQEPVRPGDRGLRGGRRPPPRRRPRTSSSSWPTPTRARRTRPGRSTPTRACWRSTPARPAPGTTSASSTRASGKLTDAIADVSQGGRGRAQRRGDASSTSASALQDTGDRPGRRRGLRDRRPPRSQARARPGTTSASSTTAAPERQGLAAFQKASQAQATFVNGHFNYGVAELRRGTGRGHHRARDRHPLAPTYADAFRDAR